MDWTSKVGDWIVGITQISVMLLTLSIVWGVLFGNTVPFIGTNVVANISGIITMLGSQGLVGMITLAIVVWLFRHQND